MHPLGKRDGVTPTGVRIPRPPLELLTLNLAPMAELADARASNSRAHKSVGVRVPLGAPKKKGEIMLMWLDDIRPAPQGWRHVRNVDQAIRCLQTGDVEVASLDHDLGDEAAHGGDGHCLTNWMAESGCWPTRGIRIHSANPVGRDAMLATIDRYGPYPLGWGNSRGDQS